jgi:hypothetical protein
MTRTKNLALLLGMLGMAACDAAQEAVPTGPAAPDAPPTAVAALVGPEAPRDSAAADALARAIAGAFANAEVRRSVHQAWRNSPVSAHKLVLQEFVSTPEGQRLVQAAARAAGTTPEGIRGLIARVPAMDFYVPRRTDRRTWKATADVAVFVTVQEDDEVVQGYTTWGERLVLRGAEEPGRAAVLLHPAEPKGRRVDPQPAGPGEVIQDAGDGERSGAVSQRGPDGEWTTVDLAELVARRHSARKGTTSGGGLRPAGPSFDAVPGATTFLTTIYTYEMDGAGAQDCELRYTLKYYGTDGGLKDERRYTDYNVPCPGEEEYRTPTQPQGLTLAPWEPDGGTTEYMRLYITEIDEWSNDNWQYATFQSNEFLTTKCDRYRNFFCAHLNW